MVPRLITSMTQSWKARYPPEDSLPYPRSARIGQPLWKNLWIDLGKLNTPCPSDLLRVGGTVLRMTDPSGSVDPLSSFETIASLRRSSLRVDPDRAIPDELIDRLIAVSATAPNHKRTFPWRFRIITGEGRAELGEALALDLIETAQPEAKIEKARSKYLRAPVLIAVASIAGEDPTMTAENRDAVAAAIQTLLLGATAADLASYWSTGAAMTSVRLREFCGFDETDTIVGLLYLGWPIGDPPPIDRPAPESLRIGTSTQTP
jgi:nitroreductase